MLVTRSLRPWKAGEADSGIAGEVWSLGVTNLKCLAGYAGGDGQEAVMVGFSRGQTLSQLNVQKVYWSVTPMK